MVQAAGHTQAPCKEYREGNLVELGRLPVGCAIELPVLVPAAIRSLVRLKVPERAKCRVGVAAIEQSGCNPAEVSWPDEVVDVVAVMVELAPRRRGCRYESACV